MINRKSSFDSPRIQEIIKQMDTADEAYYNKGDSVFSDEEYDNLKDELRSLAPQHPRLNKIGQPISKVTDWKKAKHKIAMRSQNKVNTIEEFKKWANEIGDQYYIVEDKLDGCSIDMEYDNGNLIKAITRGDGVEGEDIFSNVRRMKNVKLKINSFTGSKRGEIFLFADDFEAINAILQKEGKEELANPRNSATGIAKRFDSRFSEYLSILYYDIETDLIDFDEEMQKIEYIKKNGLKVCFYKKCTVQEVIDLYLEYEKHLRAETNYDIDGLVVKANSISIQKKHGLLGGNAKAQIAWKFTSMKAETFMKGIEWSNGRNRRITPIAILEPVRIGGVTVQRASLHNVELFKKLNPGKGDKVLVSRQNDVIPQIQKIIESKNNPFEIPTHCPVCNTKLEIEGKFLNCPNDSCPALTTGNLLKWLNGLEIRDISESTVEALYDAGKLKELADLYYLKPSDISELEGYGEKSAKKILENIHAKKELTLPEFLGNLNMNGFATSRVELLVEAGYDSLDKVFNVQVQDLIKIKGIEVKTANQIIKGLQSKAKVITNLLKAGITIKAIQKKQASSSKLKDLSFCFTGAILKCTPDGKRYTRDMMEQLVIDNGGTVESVTKNLTYLVQADPSSMSSKSQKAKDLGVKILSELDFFTMVE